MADDYNGDNSTSGSLAVGGSTKGVFEMYGDRDWFKLRLEAGQTYVLTLAPSLSGRYVNNSLLWLYDADSQALASTQATYSIDKLLVLNYTPVKTGDYYLSAYGFNSSLFNYTVSAALAVSDPVPADSSTTALVTVGGSYTGRFEAVGDRDWIKFHAEAGQHYTFSTATQEGNVALYNFQVADANGRLADSAAPFEPLASGDYYISVEGHAAGSYTVGLGTVADDYARNASTSGVLAVGGQASGQLQYDYDVDAFRMALQAGQVYRYLLTGSAADMAYLSLQVMDAGGKLLTVVADRIDATTVAYTLAQPPASGEYYVQVYSQWSASRASYTLKAVEAVADDHGDTRASATAAAVGETVKGSLQVHADVDVVKVSLQAGVTYDVALGTPDGTPGNGMSVKLTDPGGVLIGTYTVGQSYGTYTPTTSGDYYLTVSTTSSTAQAYTLKMLQPADDYSANTSTSGKLALGVQQAGVLEKGGGDVDWLAVDLEAGVTYWFNGTILSDQSYGFASSMSSLSLLDSQGRAVAVLDSGGSGEPVLAYLAAESGRYYLQVGSFKAAVSSYGSSGSYQVLVQRGQTDDHGADAAHAGTLGLGPATAARLEINNDKDAFKLHVQAGHDYAIELSTTNVGSGKLGVVTDSGGYVSLSSDNGSYGKVVQLFRATTTGEYLVTVQGGRAGDYTVKATEYALDDYGVTAASAGQLPVNGRVAGVIESPVDADWVKVHLDAGRTYVFDMLGAPSGSGTLPTISNYTGIGSLTLYGLSGYSVAYSDKTAEPRLTYIATVSGDYYLAAQGSSGNTGSYTLVATETSTDVVAPTVTKAAPAAGATGVSLYARIEIHFSELVRLGDTSGIKLTDGSGNTILLPSSNSSYDGRMAPTIHGDTLYLDAAAYLAPGTTYTLTLPSASVLDLAGNQFQGATSYSFTTVAAVDSATAGNDILIGSGTGLGINGGGGIDTVYYGDMPSAQSVSRVGDHFLVRKSILTPGDSLVDVERLVFRFDAMALDVDGQGHGGQAYRLYMAAFDRYPDQAGVGYWMAQLDQGMSLREVANNFVHSAEFLAKYGAYTSDAAFINLLYQNVLDRSADSAGAAYWLQSMHDGMDRADVLLSFSESAENQYAVAKIIGNGFHYLPYV